jgi:hypothetical protein
MSKTETTNYRGMTEPDLLEALGVDARNWAEAFCQCTLFQDRGLAETRFANAMMAEHDNFLKQFENQRAEWPTKQ